MVEEAKKAQKEAAGDYSHLKNKKGEIVGTPLPQPTLPSLTLDDDDFDDVASYRTRTPGPPGGMYSDASSAYQSDAASGYHNYYNEKSTDYVPPMPAYNPYSTVQGSDVNFQASQGSFGVDMRQQYYDDDQDSQANLNYPSHDISRPGTAPPYQQQQQQAAYLNPADVYGGRAPSPGPAGSGYHVAYDDASTAQNTPNMYGGYDSGYSNAYAGSGQDIGRRPSPGPGRL